MNGGNMGYFYLRNLYISWMFVNIYWRALKGKGWYIAERKGLVSQFSKHADSIQMCLIFLLTAIVSTIFHQNYFLNRTEFWGISFLQVAVITSCSFLFSDFAHMVKLFKMLAQKRLIPHLSIAKGLSERLGNINTIKCYNVHLHTFRWSDNFTDLKNLQKDLEKH